VQKRIPHKFYFHIISLICTVCKLCCPAHLFPNTPRISREYWMIYRGPGFLVVVWFSSTPILSPNPGTPSGCWTGGTQWHRKILLRQLADGRGCVWGAESCDGEKAWSSISHIILSAYLSSTTAEKRWESTIDRMILISIYRSKQTCCNFL